MPEDEKLIVEHKVTRKWRARAGTVTGARIVLLFVQGGAKTVSAAQVASRLDMEPGYVRRVLNALAKAHILSKRKAHQPGTPDVNVYRLSRKAHLGEEK